MSFRAIWKYEPPLVSGPIRVVAWTTILAVITFACLFRALPPVRIRWRHVWLAALLCAVSWVVASELLALYGVLFGGSRSAYGALGAVLAGMLWVNGVSKGLFFGAGRAGGGP